MPENETLALKFLLARIAEDEAFAAACPEETFGGRPWTPGSDLYAMGNDWISGIGIATRRLLAECAAKRKVIDAAFDNAAAVDGEWGCRHSPDAIRTGVVGPDFDGDTVEPLPAHCYGPPAAAEFLRPLAAVYSDHDEFRDEWRQ